MIREEMYTKMKLVRDKIPEHLEKLGVKAKFNNVKSNKNFIELLKEKLIEEALEIKEAYTDEELKEELADLLEVYGELVAKLGFTLEEIGKIAEKKYEDKGGFERGVILISREGTDTRNG